LIPRKMWKFNWIYSSKYSI